MNDPTVVRSVDNLLFMAETLLRMREAIRKAKRDGKIDAEVIATRRATAMSRELRGVGNAHDAYLTPAVAVNHLEDAMADIDEKPKAEQQRIAHYVRGISLILETLSRADVRLNSAVSGVFTMPRGLQEKVNELIGSAIDARAAYGSVDPVIDEAIVGGAFGEALRDDLARAVSIEVNAGDVAQVDSLTRMLSEKFDAIKAEQEKRLLEYRALRDKYPNVTQEEVDAMVDDYNSWLREIYSPVQDARAKMLKAKRETGAAAYAEVGTKIIQRVADASPVSMEDATRWAEAQEVTTQARNRLKKLGYPLEKLRTDMAEFYRITGGRLPSIRVHSDGDTRANATDIEKHDEVGTINMGSGFDRRVLWHEMAHHLEADPVAKTAAGQYIRRRSLDGKVYSLRSMTGNRGYRSNEVAMSGNFFSPYVGKIYRDGVTEVFSMGIESFSDPEMLARRAIQDPQTLEFIAGYLSRPIDNLARVHMGLREIMREMNESSMEAKGDWVQDRIKELAATVELKPSTDTSWIPPEMQWALSKYIPVGLLADSGYFLFTGKVTNYDTKRKTTGFVVINTASDVRFNRMDYATKDIDIPRAAVAIWRKKGVLPYMFQLTNEAKIREAMSS